MAWRRGLQHCKVHDRQAFPDAGQGDLELEAVQEPLLKLFERQVVLLLQPGFQGFNGFVGELTPRSPCAFLGFERTGGVELQVFGHRFVADVESPGGGKP